MIVAVVGELVVGGWQLLEALGGDGREIAAEFCKFREDDGPPSYEAVDERLLTHLHHKDR